MSNENLNTGNRRLPRYQIFSDGLQNILFLKIFHQFFLSVQHLIYPGGELVIEQECVKEDKHDMV